MTTTETHNRKLRILVAPLDWGLGHATRCIPIIRSLLARNHELFIACNGRHKNLLQAEFPSVHFIHLEGYNVQYARNFLLVKLIAQLGKIQRAITNEKQALDSIVSEFNIDWVISDNRYGLHHNSIATTFITHQLRVKLPAIFTWVEPLIQKMLYRHINQFSACWVPDLPDESRSLSGKLGHTRDKPTSPVSYIGWLSRFKRLNTEEKQGQILVILSGPEPQRSLFEAQVFSQLKKSTLRSTLLRGLPGDTNVPQAEPNLTIVNHLETNELEQKVSEAEFVISRSGYSTLMDMFTLQKKCIFIPTPGQTEQEYLGKTLAQKQMAVVYQQADFDVEKALIEARNFHFHFPLNSMNNLLEMAIDNFISRHFSDTSNLETSLN